MRTAGGHVFHAFSGLFAGSSYVTVVVGRFMKGRPGLFETGLQRYFRWTSTGISPCEPASRPALAVAAEPHSPHSARGDANSNKIFCFPRNTVRTVRHECDDHGHMSRKRQLSTFPAGHAFPSCSEATQSRRPGDQPSCSDECAFHVNQCSCNDSGRKCPAWAVLRQRQSCAQQSMSIRTCSIRNEARMRYDEDMQASSPS